MARPRAIDPFPRNSAHIVRSYVGKKITLSTTDFHYLVGRLLSVQDDDQLVIEVGHQLVKLPRHNLATIQEADAALAEYVK